MIEVTQETTTVNHEATILTLVVPEDGKVHIKFKLKDEVLMLFIRVSIGASRTSSLAHFIMSNFCSGLL